MGIAISVPGLKKLGCREVRKVCVENVHHDPHTPRGVSHAAGSLKRCPLLKL